MLLWKSKPVNYGDRKDGAQPSILLVHYTGMESAEVARERLTDPKAEVSAHYLVDEDGSVENLVPEGKRAWHAGVSYWAGEKDINSHSIGIEIVNPGHEFGYRPFPQIQMDAVLKLSQDIMARRAIADVLAHSDVAPERKKDPGELFNWQWLAEYGVGIWPDPSAEDREKAVKLSNNDYEVEQLFITYGYNPMCAFEDVVTAFHRHYCPELFDGADTGKVCVETVARLLSVLRQRGLS